MNRATAACLRILVGCALAWCCDTAHAADNAARGGVGGIDNGTLTGGDGTGNARLSLFPTDLALVKQARALNGTVLPDQALVLPGQEIYFVLYVDNPTEADVADVAITDLLDETQFAYVAGTLENTVVPSGSSDAAIWSAGWTGLTDNLGSPDDAASVMDSGSPPGLDRVTFGGEGVQTNLPLTVPAHGLRAVRFRVRVL